MNVLLKFDRPVSFLFLLFSLILTPLIFAQAKETYPVETEKIYLHSVRKVGIDFVKSNLDESRSFMAKLQRPLRGVLEMPDSEESLSGKLEMMLDEVARNTGRFWTISATQELRYTPAQNAQDELRRLLEKVEGEYSLDGWFSLNVRFSPDGTNIQLRLIDSKLNEKTLAREDILIKAQADLTQVRSAIEQAVNRIIETLGHDGSITYKHGDFVTINYGTTSGLKVGQELFAGYVLLSSMHPASGEYLRSQRIPIYRLSVVNVQENSAVCKIQHIDRTLIRDDESQLLSHHKILSWKQNSPQDSESWKRVNDPVAIDMDYAERGFGQGLVRPQELPPQKEIIKKAAIDSQDEQTDTTNIPSTIDESGWALRKINLSLFSSFTDISLKAGKKIIGPPLLLINTYGIGTEIVIDNEIQTVPELIYTYSLPGSGLSIGNPNFTNLLVDVPVRLGDMKASTNNMSPRLLIGGALVANAGTYYKNSTTTESLSYFSIMGDLLMSGTFYSLFPYELRTGLSPLDLINGSLVFIASLEVRYKSFYPESLSVRGFFYRYGDKFSMISLGVTWNILPFYNN